ncbi:uncharacterized protein [Panulirus ornatus]|uniref:uncharacterized protein n=1 Tax=Panulirus ornatus TaxID=150431 RepID=UPI003A873C04
MTSFFGSRYLPDVFGRATHKLGALKEPGEEKTVKMARKDFCETEKVESEGTATEKAKDAGNGRNSQTHAEARSNASVTEDQVSRTSGSLTWEQLTPATLGLRQVTSGDHSLHDVRDGRRMPRYAGSVVGLGGRFGQGTCRGRAPESVTCASEAAQNFDAHGSSSFGTENGVANDQSLREDHHVHIEDLERGTKREVSVSPDIRAAPSTDGNPENLYVKTVWNTFRIDVMQAISGLGSRLTNPPASDVMYMRPIGVPNDTPQHHRRSQSERSESGRSESGSPRRKIQKLSSRPLSIFGNSRTVCETRVHRLDKPELSSGSWRQPRTLRWLRRPWNQQVVLMDFQTQGQSHLAADSDIQQERDCKGVQVVAVGGSLRH